MHPFSTLKFNALVCQNQNFGMSKFNPSVRQSSTSLYVKVHLFSTSKLNPLVCQSATPQNVKRSTLQYVKVQHHRSSKFKTCTTECQSTTLQNVKVQHYRMSKYNATECQSTTLQNVKVQHYRMSKYNTTECQKINTI